MEWFLSSLYTLPYLLTKLQSSTDLSRNHLGAQTGPSGLDSCTYEAHMRKTALDSGLTQCLPIFRRVAANSQEIYALLVQKRPLSFSCGIPLQDRISLAPELLHHQPSLSMCRYTVITTWLIWGVLQKANIHHPNCQHTSRLGLHRLNTVQSHHPIHT